MAAINFVESYKNYAIEIVITSILWFLGITLVTAIAVGWIRGVQLISTRWGNLTLALIVLVTSVAFAFLHMERWMLQIIRRVLFGH